MFARRGLKNERERERVSRACQDFPFLHAGTIIMIVNFVRSLFLFHRRTHASSTDPKIHAETFHVRVASR